MWKSTNAKPENTYTSPARKGGAPNERKIKMLTLFNDIPPYNMHSVALCVKQEDTAIFETALTVQDNKKIARYRVWILAWKGVENRQRSGAQSKSYMMDVVAPSDWTIGKVHNTILVYLAGIKWMKMSSGIQWLHADYQPQLHDSTQEDFILYLDDFLDSSTPQF